ncbi:hypothetical protein DUI87_35465 [Hirundo rustica rustica]|uniref:Uncharacterized protein n=1 Tax=Hirundo rustica rustica TaxID=333673 RepID=A0A3M0IIP4_HIRRU|nr:hypothetical protein DUI87_35457 [Hirundo rustica rustica]RMB88172.1 hypothetical protein DUI87_35465 [Hirundo rustica rustica]
MGYALVQEPFVPPQPVAARKQEDGSIPMENGVIAVYLDTMRHLTLLQLLDSGRCRYCTGAPARIGIASLFRSIWSNVFSGLVLSCIGSCVPQRSITEVMLDISSQGEVDKVSHSQRTEAVAIAQVSLAGNIEEEFSNSAGVKVVFQLLAAGLWEKSSSVHCRKTTGDKPHPMMINKSQLSLD